MIVNGELSMSQFLDLNLVALQNSLFTIDF